MHVEYWQIRYITEIVTQSKCVAQSRKKCRSSQHIDIWLLHLSLSFCCLSFWALLLIATHHDVRAVCKNMLPAQHKMRLATAVMLGIGGYFYILLTFSKRNKWICQYIDRVHFNIDRQTSFVWNRSSFKWIIWCWILCHFIHLFLHLIHAAQSV